MKKSLLKVIRRIFYFMPFALGFTGLYILGGETLEMTIFYCLKMYAFSYSGAGSNIFIIAARWLAPAATLSGAVTVFVGLRKMLQNFLRYRRGDSVAVYGPVDERTAILSQLGKRGINGDEKFIRAQRYILLWEDKENFDFYNQHRAELAGASVYMKCRSIQAGAVKDVDLHMFCPEEAAARMFWEKKFIYGISRKHGHAMKIVIIGFGTLGEKLLTSALTANIFSPDQRIEYHIFGDGEEFRAVHTSLDSISDPVVFHSEPWYRSIELAAQADMIIVAEQNGQTDMLERLLLAAKGPVIDVFSSDNEILSIIDGHDRLRLFDWKKEVQKPDFIFTDKLFENAKRINLRYAHIYSGVEENEQNLEAEWKKLDAFTRYSNLCAADYHSMRLKMLETDGLPNDAEELSAEAIEQLSELEHIRWSRYHYLNNWTYGVPENGGSKDASRRIHRDLLPYDKLSEQEKEKDRENIKVLLSVKDI